MAIQSAFFPLDGSNKTFPSTKHIATKQHVAIWLQVREDGSYVQLSSNQYDLINNSIVLKEVPSATIYRRVEVRVADNVDELTTSLSDIAIVASIAADIVEVVETVVPNMDEILEADDNAAIATTQAGIATTKAGEASTSATTATTQAGIATTKASEASTSASNASTSESNALDYRDTTLGYRDEAETFRDEASTSATNTANIYDEFDDRYLGAKATQPAVDNDGDPLVVGALFFDTTANQMKVYDGSTWQLAGSSVSGITEQYRYTATQGQDTFLATYDVGFVYVYVNGIRLFDTDYTATNGTSVELAEALNAGDSVEIVAFGTFEVANTYTRGEADALLADKADKADTYTKSEVYTKDETETRIALAVESGTTGAYGVQWNQETDEYDLLGATNRTQIQSQMRRCVLHNDASSTTAVGDTSLSGTVNYYLDPYDSTLKEDGVTPSVLDGTDGNVMVEIPKFYYKHELNGNDHQWWVSPTMETGFSLHPAFMREGTERDYRYYRAYQGYNSGGTLLSRSGVTPTRSQTISTFRTQAMANGTGWSQNDYNLVFAVQLLFLTEYGTLNTQATLGNGNDTGADYGLTTGQSNGIGNGSSGSLNNNMWMSYRGIENWYADIWEWVDGINIQDYEVFLNSNPSTFASDVFTGDYVSTGTFLLTGATDTFIKKLADSNQGFFPTLAGGSSSTYLTDAFWSATGARVVQFGGGASNGLSAGGLCLAAAADSATSGERVGGGVSF